MSHPALPLSTTDSSSSREDQIDETMDAVDWNALASLARSLFGVASSRWGGEKAGGYNLVRYLHFDDANKTVLVARVPLRPAEGRTFESSKSFARRMSSEIATMRYIAAHTSIPVPRVIHHNVEANGGGIGSPYMIMTKVDGVLLSSVWKKMRNPERMMVLRQVVDIFLELASHRFDKIGMLFEREGDDSTKQAWYVDSLVDDFYGTGSFKNTTSATFTSAIDYWHSFTTYKLKNVHATMFGSTDRIDLYANIWFMRSLIPTLYDTSLDAAGFPIRPGDFHAHNIFIVNADTSPCISGVIDWEFSYTSPTSSFAQYPLFIVDHPHWEDDNPLRKRNFRDQIRFDALMREAEMKKNPDGDLQLSQAYASCRGVYLFEQAIQYWQMFDELCPELFTYIYGDENLSSDYYWALVKFGILKKEARQFEFETKVWKVARKVLGKRLLSDSMRRENFRMVVQNHVDEFVEGGIVRKWLATQK